ncbi:23S rRNA (uracil(1939)-C(5))-methyltransferase RlmD [Thermoflavimicrobium dichotomicum]|uniref:tRNA (Uracil-5-)-methyltransferase/23S rRNA (Uracil1939-C5)-methyltransferase n=1 Tax=Thermoflavimicrobium dichotomicum TaxID=46223 RepID=A0A1I3JE13_9BACL|nr:23S rRNA (uracil(1939)-C(5))-methyltransferase RlmD [Thermoflavimicrobium dichotomicum]SFI58198.1 tRNA (uracil-5-)-methyltransferase/23S rRNA (uracil1939-C5)-methyltransferase [Thermoflavimicrobium dichotomicum]
MVKQKAWKKNKKIHLHKGQEVELSIRRLGINGEGVGYYQKQVVFVDGAIPGEIVVARITDIEKNFAKAKLIRIKKKSAYRTDPQCPVYDTCGGCQLQHMDYRFQRRLKRELVQEAFRKYTHLDEIPIEPMISMSEPWTYRNKAQLPLQQIGNRVAMGMFSAKSHRLVQVDDCLVQHPLVNQVLSVTREIIEQLKISVYEERKHQGVIRHLVARIAFATEEVQLVLVTRTSSFPEEKTLISMVTEQLPQVKSIVLNHNPHKTSLIFGDRNRLLWGKEKITEKLGELTFLLSPRAFFQLNPVQTAKLYEEVRKLAKLTGSETIIDAYCGVGTIGLWLAKDAKKVLGMDTIPEAIEDARENAKINGIEHAEYFAGEAESLLPDWIQNGLQPDLVVVDPPRTGLGQPLIDTLLKVKIPRLIYVSCNPSTLAKDCHQLLQGGYELKRIVPLDMFPQTAHVESVTLLEAI